MEQLAVVFTLFQIDDQSNYHLYGIFTSVEGAEWASKVRPNGRFEKKDDECIFYSPDGNWMLVEYNLNRLYMQKYSIDVYGPSIDPSCLGE